jgi:DNA gyrase subunit A
MNNVETVDFYEIFEQKYKEYAKEVIENRALIDSRDGLKPVNRRILWSMFESRFFSSGNTVKLSRVVGNVMSRLHPHGDSSIEDAMVRLAQDCSLRVPLLIPQGNFGDEENRAASARYIEAKLSKAGEMLLEDTDMEIVNFSDNYDNTCEEPVFLPSKFPNILINGGGSGMAVGIAFRDCCHNPKEICDAIRLFLNNPNASIDDLLSIVKGPDWNCYGYVINNEEIGKYIEFGKGSVTVLGKARIETENSKQLIIISELPYQYGRSQFMEDIAKNIKLNPNGILSSSISKFKDLSDRKNGTNIIIEIKNGISASLVINEIINKTGFKQNIPINMNVLVNNTPIQCGLIDLIKSHIEHRRKIIINRSNKKLKLLNKELKRYDALISAISIIDDIINLIKTSNNYESASNKLIKLLSIDHEQAKYILDIPLKRLTKLEITSLKKEKDNVLSSINTLNNILKNQKEIDKIISGEMDEVEAICDCQRKTKVINSIPKFEDEKVKVTKENIYFMLNYDLKGKIIRKFNDDFTEKERNVVMRVQEASSMDYLMCVNNGDFISNRIYSLDINNRNAAGSYLFQEMKEQRDIFVVSEDAKYISSLTDDSKIKKTKISDLSIGSKKILPYIKLSNNKVINDIVHDDNVDYIIATNDGFIIRYNSSNINPVGRLAQGVSAMSKTAGKPVRLLSIPSNVNDGYIVAFTENGWGKKVHISEIPLSLNKGGKGVSFYKSTKETGKLIDICFLNKNDKLIAITEIGSTVPFDENEIKQHKRLSRGDLLVDLIMNQKLSKIENVFIK